MFPTNYRVATLWMTVNFLGRPLLGTLFLARFLLPQHPYVHYVLLYFLTSPLYWIIYVQYKEFVKRRDAAARGAILAPEIKGKWFGNVDLIVK